MTLNEPVVLAESRAFDGWFALLEDDGQVGWLYLLNENEEICGDVWAFNSRAVSSEHMTQDRGSPPPAPPEVLVNPEEDIDPKCVSWAIQWDDLGTAYLLADGEVRCLLSRSGERRSRNLRGESGWGAALTDTR